MIRLQVILVITTTYLFTTANTGVPIATAGPSIINEGKDALLTCVVSDNSKNNTVIWKRNENEVLTAGMLRVSSDQRISVLHDENPKSNQEIGSEVWVLLIKNLKTSDTGSYMCELNSDPALRSIQILSVISKESAAKGENVNNVTDSTSFLVPPPLDGNDNRSYWRSSNIPPQITHDFTDCCERANISAECMGFCNVHNILDGTTGIEPESCEKEFPNIVRCMADGRNHAPCCIEKKIPDLCQDMCRGEYTPFTDELRTRVSCVQHTLNGLQCILEGVQRIPSAPQDISVDSLTETSLQLSWSPPEKLSHKVQLYTVNVTALHNFDDDNVAETLKMSTTSGISQLKRLQERTILQSVPSNQTKLLLQQLKPLTMYSVYVIAVNEFGTSLPSERLRIFTHTNEFEDNVAKNSTTKKHDVGVPNLPDIRSCCEMNGMTHRLCLDKMCDPQKTDLATLPDFMVCAPWSNITFTCLANNIDHTPCCRSRGIPAACFPLCSGSVASLDFSLFKCLRFMSEYSSCLFQGYGVLTSAPIKLRTIAKTDKFVILDWNKPKVLADTVITYHIKFRRLGIGDDYYTLEKKTPPLIMEGLEAEAYYEFYVVAVNTYGKSEPSSRLIVRTLPGEIIEEPKRKYNMTTCCQASGLLPQCASLCNYNIRMSDIERLGPACRAQMSVIARCAAGGRDHTLCCQRRGVAATCLTLCRGVMPTSSATNDCLSYAGNILQCFEEGTENIPGPVRNMHATAVTNTSISLTWSQPEFEGDDTSNDTTIVTNLKSDVFNTNNNNNKDSSSSSSSDNGSSLLITSTPMTLATDSSSKSSNNNNNDNNNYNNDTWGYGYENVDDNDIDFIVQYGKVNNMTMYETVAKLENELTTIQTSIELTNLEPHALYRIMVVTRGKYGTSLPSSMLLINTTQQQKTTISNDTTTITTATTINNRGNNFGIVTANHPIHGAPSPPHSLTIVAQSATWMQLTWQPPEFSYPHEKILYRVYHKPMKSEKFNKIETKVAWLRLSNLKPSSQHILYVEAIGENAISLPSETLVAWTDPALPAFVDPPTVHPADNISEGGSMTILCLALGNPAPTISLYVGGHLVRQDTSRHMITVIHNVSASMEHVSCYADNGYGVPMQATRRVNICYPPKIQAAGITVASVGDAVELRCVVDAKPIPKTIFWRDHDGRVPVIQGGNYDISMKANDTKSTLYTMVLRINKLQATDVGDYFCHAENPFGTSTIPVSVRIRNTPNLHRNVSQCCAELNVTMACRSACSYYVDFDAIADRPACIGDFDKLMSCAADGSDHRPCCADANVPRKCLNWCRGEPVRSKEICSLQYSRIIIGCFESNRDRLPGPPENIAVSVVSDTQVVIRWDPPSKNPNVVDGYRVFYHETILPTDISSTTTMATNSAEMTANPTNYTPEIQRIDVKETSVTIDNLKKDVLYELVVKAGNNHGASVLTDPIKFTLGEHHVTSATTYSQTVGTISGILASILAILLAAVSIIFWRRHRAGHKSSGNGVAFENPTYSCNLEQVQLPTVTSNFPTTTTTTAATTTQTTTSQNNGGGGGVIVGISADGADYISSSAAAAAVVSTSQQQKQQQQQQTQKEYQQHQNNTRQYNEINPSIYQELKLGQAGAGYRELVP